MAETTEQVENKEKKVPNPSGKGGFADNPQNINAGGRPKNQESFSYWLNYFKNMTVKDFLNWLKDNPESERSVASELAYTRVFNARTDLPEFKEVADRTEGKASQPIEFDSNGDKIAELFLKMNEQTHSNSGNDKGDS